MYLADVYTISANLAGLPGLALPAGLSSAGMPIGMQLMGPVFSESTLFRAARMFEQAGSVGEMIPALARD
jgi:aspartyl-tRNA(Asn)/glutamyl-tRNA(Gln) amidotransferase subunit A